MKVSLPKQARQLERYIYNLPAARRLNMLSTEPREAMIKLRTSVSAAYSSVSSYYSSDDSAEQLHSLNASLEHLKEVREAILEASTYDLLDTADVAHLSALNEHIIDQLK